MPSLNDRFLSFLTDTTYIKTIGTPLEAGIGNNQFQFPIGVAVDGNGKSFVTDYNNHRIQIFNEDGSYTATIGITGLSGSGNNQFYNPFGIAVDAEGKIYVTDHFNNRVQIFNADYSYAATIGTTRVSGSSNNQFDRPTGIAVDSDGKIYVADYGNNRVQVFNADYSYAATIGLTRLPGNANDQFRHPYGIAIDAKGMIYVADGDNNRVQVFNADYSYAATIGTGTVGSNNDQFTTPYGVAVGAEDKVYVADRSNNRVQIFNSDYTYAGTIGSTGAPGSSNKQLNRPGGIAMGPEGKIYVADMSNHRIQVFEDGESYAVMVTPTADGLVTVDLAADKVTDKAGNANIAAEQFSITYDGTAPTVVISSEGGSTTNKTSFSVTFTFKEKVDGFDKTDITVSNGAITDWQTNDDKTFVAELTPTSEGKVTIDVAANVATDKAGNNNTAATRFSITYDATAPTVAISSAESDITNKATFEVKFTFNEEVSGFTTADITVENGGAANLKSSDNKVFTADIAAEKVGLLTINVAANVASDAAGNGNTAASQFSITYDVPPVITASQELNVLEESTAGTAVGTVIATDALEGTKFQNWKIVSGNADNAFAIDSKTGEISVANEAALNGSAESFTLSVTVSDGTYTSKPEDVIIKLVSVNDAPSFVKGSDQNVAEDAGVQNISEWATDIHAGAPNESDQTLTFEVTNDNAALFAVAPTVSADGTLTYTTAANAHGVANVTVTLSDDGGTENGGVDQSAGQTFTITVNPVNDAPVVAQAVPDQTAYKEESFEYVLPANSFEDVDTDDVLVLSAKLSNVNALPAWLHFDAATGSFSGTPALADEGSLDIVVTASDKAGAFASDTFVLVVVNPNTAPTDILLSATEVEENKPSGTLVGTLTTVDPDADDTHVYQLVGGEGSADNTYFYIEQNQLFTNAAFDSEIRSSYSIRILSNDGNDGMVEKAIVIQVKNVEDARVFIPNLFSPNGDSNNDVFRVRANGLEKISFRIFNRWGEMVFETSNIHQATETGWDGSYKGKEMPTGTYVWQITGKFSDGTPVLFEGKNTGNITLIR